MIAGDVLDFGDFEWDSQLFPKLLVSLRERLRSGSKDEITGIEEEANLHLPAPLRVEPGPSVDGLVGPGHPQLRPNPLVAIRSANAARLVAGGRAGVARPIGIHECHLRAQGREVI